MRLIVTGGGTGGHIYPAVAIAKRVKVGIPACDILYIGSDYGLEGNIVRKEGLPYKSIAVRGFDRKRPLKALKAGFLLFKALFQAFMIIKRYRPDLVIGTGGYVSGPVVMMASLLGVDTMIHEQNAAPGLTTSLLERFATKIMVSYKESIPYFKKQNRITFTGNPVRQEFYSYDRETVRKEMGLSDQDVLVISSGGSNGAAMLNSLAKSLMQRLASQPRVHYYHITGKRFYDAFMKDFDTKDLPDRLKVMSYTNDIAKLMVAADLSIGRAGAVSLAEMAAVNLPGILIPSPNVANNHQELNARAVHKSGACLMILEKEVTSDKIFDILMELIDQPAKLASMRKGYEALTKEHALNTIMSMVYAYHLR